MTTNLIEVNYDGIVGPSHHFGGLGIGNLASQSHRGTISNPRLAALQGLSKARLVAASVDPTLARQAFLPPQLRPRIDWLRMLGFKGDDTDVLAEAGETAPHLLGAAWSASAMWTANAATVSPATNCRNKKTNFTPANLSSSLHRSLEPQETASTLREIFSDLDYFQVHSPLPCGQSLRDEGAANHLRLWCQNRLGKSDHCSKSIEILVYGAGGDSRYKRFFARQAEDASRAICRLHGLDSDYTFMIPQEPAAIDAGAFHNDVVATSYERILIYHESAFLAADDHLDRIRTVYETTFGQQPIFYRVANADVSLEAAVASYLFNSQIIPISNDSLLMICPQQCQEIESVRKELDRILALGTPLREVRFVELRESMWNGGGPACLRLRVPLAPDALARTKQTVLWSEKLDAELVKFIESEYPTSLSESDLTDSKFAQHARLLVQQCRCLLGLSESFH